MRLSIITINYNNREGLERTAKSIIGQGYKDYEWIVVDGGSTDGSRDKIEGWKGCVGWYCSENDGGPYDAMNKGLEHIRGEWVLFLNSGDELYDSGTLDYIFGSDILGDIVYGNAWYQDERGGEIHESPEEVSTFYFYNTNICHQAIIYRRELFEHGGYDTTYKVIADWVFNIRSTLTGAKFQKIDRTIVKAEGGGISSNQEAVWREVERMREEEIPTHLKRDMEKLQEIHYLRRRKTLRWIIDKTQLICNYVDKILTRIEKRRY